MADPKDITTDQAGKAQLYDPATTGEGRRTSQTDQQEVPQRAKPQVPGAHKPVTGK